MGRVSGLRRIRSHIRRPLGLCVGQAQPFPKTELVLTGRISVDVGKFARELGQNRSPAFLNVGRKWAKGPESRARNRDKIPKRAS
jgi:hypothetical protein